MNPELKQTGIAGNPGMLLLLLLPLAFVSAAFAQGPPPPPYSDTNWLNIGGIWTGNGSPGLVNAAVADGAGNLYVGGFFARAGNTSATNIARWNGSSWSALGPGVNLDVDALAISGTNLYVGGDFTNAGALAVNYIAKWDGNSWSALGSGTDHSVYALAVSGNNLFVGGRFFTAGGVVANEIAEWDGNYWYSLGSGMNQNVYALAVSGTNLYAGGLFTTAGGLSANYVAQWNGSTWSALGTGVSRGGAFSIIQALAVSGSNLYAGGFFTNAGGVMASSIARWNGSSWSAMGTGVTGQGDGLGPAVQALAVSGSTVFVGGDFTFQTSPYADYIARWDGSSWSALGSGVSHLVYALAFSRNNLYVGGDFTIAGTNAADGVADFVFPVTPATVILGNLAQVYDGLSKSVTVTTLPPGLAVSVTYNASTNPPANIGKYSVVGTVTDPFYQGSATDTLVIAPQLFAPAWQTNGQFQFSFPDPQGWNYGIQSSTNLTDWSAVMTLSGLGGTVTISDPNTSPGARRFYRVVITP